MTGNKEKWLPGEVASFEYHCLESDDSSDAAMWHHSHQNCTVLSLTSAEGDWPGSTFNERGEEGMPHVYRVRFADGFEYDAFEDELMTGPAFFYRPDPR